MKYKFLFLNHDREVEAQHAREIQKGDEVEMNEFFPDLFFELDYFNVTHIVFGKGIKKIYLSKRYGTAPKTSNA